MTVILTRTLFFLAVAVLVALLARRLRLPYTVGLVAAGMGLAFFHISTGASLTRDLIFDVLLPPLLFEAAIHLRWRALWRDAPPILTLATAGVMLSACVVACGMHVGLHWPWPQAIIFSLLIAATDPVAVIAMFKETGVTGRLRMLVESESLLNDGVVAVMFGLALTFADTPQVFSWHEGMRTLAFTVGGGIFIGMAAGGLAIIMAGRTDDHLVEMALSTLAAYGAFLLAEQWQASGVLATVAAGLMMGNIGLLQAQDGEESPNVLSARGRFVVIDVWEFVAFLANSLIFLLIGLRIAVIPFGEQGVWPLFGIIALVLAGRALAVYPLSALFARTRWRIAAREQHILWWGGLRGALALALALSLPEGLLMRDDIVIATFAVVAFSVLAQGITISWLLARGA